MLFLIPLYSDFLIFDIFFITEDCCTVAGSSIHLLPTPEQIAAKLQRNQFKNQLKSRWSKILRAENTGKTGGVAERVRPLCNSSIFPQSTVPWGEESSSGQGHSRCRTQGRPSLWRPHPLGYLGLFPEELQSNCWEPSRDSDLACTRRNSQEVWGQHIKWPASDNIRAKSSKLHNQQIQRVNWHLYNSWHDMVIWSGLSLTVS